MHCSTFVQGHGRHEGRDSNGGLTYKLEWSHGGDDRKKEGVVVEAGDAKIFRWHRQFHGGNWRREVPARGCVNGPAG